MRTLRLPWTRLAVVLLALLAVAGVAAALAVNRPTRGWDRGSPEGVVQAYVSAVLDGDSVAAAAQLAPGSTCSATDLDRARLPQGTQVDLVGSELRGDRALVRVAVTPDPGLTPFEPQPDQLTFRLTRTAAGWRIDGVPWPLGTCTGG